MRERETARRRKIRKRQGDAAKQLNWAKDKAKEGYDAAKNKAGETLEPAKETVASHYEAAKQKSQEIFGYNISGSARDAEL